MSSWTQVRGAGIAVLFALASAHTIVYAAAPGDPLRDFYANTLESRHADGQVFQVYLNPDHSYRIYSKGKLVRSGDYRFSDGKLCFLAQGKDAGCPPFRADLKMGETWTTQERGKADYLTLRPGRKQ